MNVQSFGFLAFLAATAAACLGMARWNRSAAAECLALACLVFYILGGGWAALLVLVLGMAVSAAAVGYLTAPDIRVQPEGDGPAARAYPRPAARRRRCFYLAAAWHIGVLAVFIPDAPGKTHPGLLCHCSEDQSADQRRDNRRVHASRSCLACFQ